MPTDDELRRAGLQAPQPYPTVETRLPDDPVPDPTASQPSFAMPASLRKPSAGATTFTAEPPAPGPVRAVLGQRSPTMASQFMPDTQAVLKGAGQDASANVNRGNYAGALGSVVRGATALVPAMSNDVLGGPLRTGLDFAGRVVEGLEGGPAQAQTLPGGPAAAAAGAPKPPVMAPPIAPPATAAPPAAFTPAAATPGQAVPGAPGAFRFVDPSGRVLYADQPGAASAGFVPPGAAAAPGAAAVPGAAVAPGAAVTAPAAATPGAVGNTVQAGAMLPSGLDQQLAQARAAAVARGEPLGPSMAAGSLPAGYGTTIPGVNAPASQGEAAVNERNAAFERDQLAQQMLRFGGPGGAAAAAGLYTGRDRNAADLQANQQREAGQTERTKITDTGQTLRERETTAATNLAQGPLRAAQVAEANAKVQAGSAQAAALSAYQRAVAGGNAKEIQRAEDALRAAQGKWDKTIPENFKSMAIPGGVDPATGMASGSGALIYDHNTGEVKRVISPAELKGPQKPVYQTGQVYTDAKGAKAKWDGTKFVPQ